MLARLDANTEKYSADVESIGSGNSTWAVCATYSWINPEVF
jgi:hypothetical protein